MSNQSTIMDTIAIVLSVVSIIGFAVLGLFLRSYLPEYLREKAKNAASKEDLAHLTTIVESVKAQNAASIERLRADLLLEGQAVERRRKVYEQICEALRIFISGHDRSLEAKKRFYSSYSEAWLWAPDEVLSKLNQFIALQQRVTQDPKSVGQDDLKQAYTDVVLAMRCDVGFTTTTIGAKDYQFVTFT